MCLIRKSIVHQNGDMGPAVSGIIGPKSLTTLRRSLGQYRRVIAQENGGHWATFDELIIALYLKQKQNIAGQRIYILELICLIILNKQRMSNRKAPSF